MRKRILVAPLDWGLGHATRCIPIVEELQRQDSEVILASNGAAYQLLKTEFPDLIIERLPAYDIHYASNNMFWNMSLQLPRIAKAIWQENLALARLIKKYQILAVIADNRFGCFNYRVKSIFITHQLQILVRNFILQKVINFINHQMIRRFDECWVPDFAGEQSLAGALALPPANLSVKYVGTLSRMQPLMVPTTHDIVVVLSGPEPQRTYLEEKIVAQAQLLPRRFLIIQGKPGIENHWKSSENIEIIGFMTGEQLNRTMAAASLVVCRSGYSSIMDLAKLGKKALFIPTPGQTEQEYLAARFLQKEIFYSQSQAALNLGEALKKAQQFRGLQPETYANSQEQLSIVISEFLRSL